jgi:plasmid stabilization system protein ParE
MAVEVVSLIEEAVLVLERHPLIGRPAESGMRELVISRGTTGFVALYDLLPGDDIVRILAPRHQREAGYSSSEERET